LALKNWVSALMQAAARPISAVIALTVTSVDRAERATLGWFRREAAPTQKAGVAGTHFHRDSDFRALQKAGWKPTPQWARRDLIRIRGSSSRSRSDKTSRPQTR